MSDTKPKRELRVAGEPILAIGRRKTDRGVALLFVLFTSGGGYHEWQMRATQAETEHTQTEVAAASKELHDLSERITRLEAVSPTEARHLADTLTRIETRLDRIDDKLEKKADRPRRW